MSCSSRSPLSCYAKLCRLWSLVFALVGGLFVVVPHLVALTLTRVGGLFSLDGEIYMGRDQVGYVLALSLMAIITVISAASAKRPEDLTLYRSLLVAKLVSTVAFLWLAVSIAPIWVLGAVTDGFVALSLWGVRLIDKTHCAPPQS